jgi:hypothetical protein
VRNDISDVAAADRRFSTQSSHRIKRGCLGSVRRVASKVGLIIAEHSVGLSKRSASIKVTVAIDDGARSRPKRRSRIEDLYWRRLEYSRASHVDKALLFK